MSLLRASLRCWAIRLIAASLLASAGFSDELAALRSRSEGPPRKVVVASALAPFSGSVEERLRQTVQLVDAAAAAAKQRYGHSHLDLVAFPEFALLREAGARARERAVVLEGEVGDTLAASARRHNTWLIVPMTLREAASEDRVSNAAVLFDRAGRVAGIFRKVHPMVDPDGSFEAGVTPGVSYPTFDCDFGRIGILICWDMAYGDAWAALARAGAELVVLPSASPQTLRPSAAALTHHFFVLTSTQRDNASLFDPIGRTIAQTTSSPDVLIHRIDLAYAILHWSEALDEGRALTKRFGDKAGYSYSSREDTGVFWSNDPSRTVGAMLRELGLEEMPAQVERVDAARRNAVGTTR